MMNEWFQKMICFCLFILPVAYAGPAAEHPSKISARIPVPSGQNMSGLRIVTENGGYLAWSKKINKIAFDRLGADGYFKLWVMNLTEAK
jgi:hypothetical protein